LTNWNESLHNYKWSPDGKMNYKFRLEAWLIVGSRDILPGVDTLESGLTADMKDKASLDESWWEWNDNSRPFHWRWPKWYQASIRDGLNMHFIAQEPRYRIGRRDPKNPEVKKRMQEKLDKVRSRRYIGPGLFKSLTTFNGVPKLDDTRMVYDTSISGLNDAVWVPRFVLPTINTHLRSVGPSTYMGDIDVGEMFLNLMLTEEVGCLAGVDLTRFVDYEGEGVLSERWSCALMGFTGSLYQACQGMNVAEEVIRGNHEAPTNIFGWSKVVMNMPGVDGYVCTMPWVYKIGPDGNHVGNWIA
jgi:hypothetical protein